MSSNFYTYLIYQGDDSIYKIKRVSGEKKAYLEAFKMDLTKDEFIVIFGRLIHASKAYLKIQKALVDAEIENPEVEFELETETVNLD